MYNTIYNENIYFVLKQ